MYSWQVYHSIQQGQLVSTEHIDISLSFDMKLALTLAFERQRTTRAAVQHAVARRYEKVRCHMFVWFTHKTVQFCELVDHSSQLIQWNCLPEFVALEYKDAQAWTGF